MAGGHPSDADREEAARPALTALLDAARARDAAALSALYREDVSWLADGATLEGPAAAAAAHMGIAARATSWDEPQQQGARAVLRWSGADGERGAVVVEVRRGMIVFAAAL